MTAFILDPQLAADTTPICALTLCDALLMRDARFPWIILVPRRAGPTELFELDVKERAILIEEVAAASRALKLSSGALKINVGALGNIVRQLHIHVVARRKGDAAWPGPVWGYGARAPYPAGAAEALASQLRAALGAM